MTAGLLDSAVMIAWLQGEKAALTSLRPLIGACLYGTVILVHVRLQQQSRQTHEWIEFQRREWQGGGEGSPVGVENGSVGVFRVLGIGEMAPSVAGGIISPGMGNCSRPDGSGSHARTRGGAALSVFL